MEETPPVFQEAARCAVCASPFSTFKRRHHCRRCGKSLCNDHSSNQIALPQLGIKSAVRVCDDCFHASRQILNGGKVSEVDKSKATDSLARLNISDSVPLPEEEIATAAPEAPVHECTCGMPLCICQVPTMTEVCKQATPNTQVLTPVITKKSHSGSSAAVKRIPARPSYGNELPSLFFSTTNSTNDGGSSMAKKYESTGEGIWEAIKNGDAGAVKDLLENGVDPNYCDKQGMSILHLAAVFNFSEITFLLMDAGAKIDAKNAQGETPLDCAPVTLQYKMQLKLKSSVNDD